MPWSSCLVSAIYPNTGIHVIWGSGG